MSSPVGIKFNQTAHFKLWHHIAYTYDGSSTADGINIYIDGVLHNGDATHNNLSATILNEYPLRVGSREGINYFRGVIDEVMIYSHVLSAGDMWDLFGGAPTPNSEVNRIDPYWRNQVPFTVTATAWGTVKDVELWHRYSPDNSDSSWEDWALFDVDNDNSDGWSWEFTAPENDGYYEFYSIAAGSREEPPEDENGNIVADARVGVDTTPPVSSVWPFQGDAYWKELDQGQSFTVSAEAVDGLSGVGDVELWYRYSLDNWTDEVVWKKRGWQLYGVDTDNTDGWSWSFVPDSYGYYEFYSRAIDSAGNQENLPGWVQTTEEDFENGALENLDTETSPGDVVLAENVVYSDNFENYPASSFPSAGGWEVAWGPSEQTLVVENVFDQSNKCFKVQGEPGGPVIVTRQIPTDTDRLGYDLWVGANGIEQRLGFLDNLFTQYAVIRFDADGWIYVDGYDGRPLQSYEQNKWYRVRVVLNKGAGNARIWVGGEFKAEISVAEGNQITAFFLNSGYHGGRLYVDDIGLVDGYLPTGVFTSPVYDSSGAWTDWGEISWDETLPPGTDITLQTKTSLDNVTWSDWSDNYTNADGENITSPTGRYIQYRAALETENLSLTPELREVRITWPAADVGARVAENLVRVAVILARPKNYIPPFGLEYIENAVTSWREVGNDLSSYYDEVSYGTADVRVGDIFTRQGQWFELPEESSGYPADSGGRRKFIEHAIDAATSAGVDLSGYEIVAVGSAYDGIFPGGGVVAEAHSDVRGKPAFIAEALTFSDTVAHETAHLLGLVLGTGEQLPDLLASHNPESWGDVDGWDLMGYVLQTHLSSWSKARLGWLGYGSMFYGIDWVEALPTLGYGGTVYRYKHAGWDTIGIGGEIWYLLEVRTDNWHYSRYDRNVPGTGLVLYKVENTYNWFGRSTRVNVVGGSPFVDDPDNAIWYDWDEEVSLVYEAKERDKTTRFWIWDVETDQDTYKMRVGINVAPYSWTEAQGTYDYFDRGAMYESPPWETQWDIYPSAAENVAAPDLDLHAYTTDGRHIGVNYETGEYEIQIENASASGDLFQGSEWISVPSGVEVYFTVSAHDVEKYFEQNPEAERRDGLYGFDIMRTDNAHNDYTSPIVGQSIPPGAEVFHEFSAVQNPDGTYSVETRQGINLLDITAWHSAIDNIPDNAFIRNPSQRKNSLKEKLEEVFEELDEALEEIEENEFEDAGEHYLEAAEKLNNDILKKLDADGQADWVSEPVLADEINSFIGLLRYKGGGG